MLLEGVAEMHSNIINFYKKKRIMKQIMNYKTIILNNNNNEENVSDKAMM